jgi:hypothetical protein
VRGCCGTAEGPRRVVLPCAGAYVSGAAGSNACPAGSVRIEAEAACRTAVAAAGKTPHPLLFVVTVRYYPRGCYYDTSDNYAYFNADPVGAGEPLAQLLCAAVASAGAPPHAAGGRCRWPPRAHAGNAQRHCRVRAVTRPRAIRAIGLAFGVLLRAAPVRR